MARIKANQLTTIASALLGLAEVGGQVEQTAASLLSLISTGNIRTLKQYDAAILDAYTANGWHTQAGRPTADSDRRSVPHTVRTYVWELRSGFREGLPVWTFPTFYALRIARKAKHASATDPTATGTAVVPVTNGATVVLPPEVAPDFEGVKVSSTDKPNGALFHDVAVCYLHLSPEDRAMVRRQLSRLLSKYQPVVLKAAA